MSSSSPELTNHQVLLNLSRSKRRRVDLAQLHLLICNRFGVRLGKRDTYSRRELVAWLYLHLASLLAGLVRLDQIPVEAHEALAAYAQTRSCREYALQLVNDAEQR